MTTCASALSTFRGRWRACGFGFDLFRAASFLRALGRSARKSSRLKTTRSFLAIQVLIQVRRVHDDLRRHPFGTSNAGAPQNGVHHKTAEKFSSPQFLCVVDRP